MKQIIAISLAAVLTVFCCVGCKGLNKTQKYQYQFFDTFDTLIQVVGYAENQDVFDAYAQQAHERFRQLNDLFDKFDSHGLENGVAAVNNQAGIAPVKVDPQLLELIRFSLEWREKTDGAVDITMGPVISLWQNYISRYKNDYENAVLPDRQELEQAAALCGMEQLEIDWSAGTVFLKQKGASLDFGAVAKGYATELVTQELKASGWQSFSISSGGNVRTVGSPQNGKQYWSVGIQDPASGAVLGEQSELLDVIYANDQSVVTSGDYQRYYMVENQRVHHIIDPSTLMPAEHYRAVTVITPDSGEADLLSTALFIMDWNRGKQLASRLGVGVVWVMADGTVTCNDEILPMLRDAGGATNPDQNE